MRFTQSAGWMLISGNEQANSVSSCLASFSSSTCTTAWHGYLPAAAAELCTCLSTQRWCVPRRSAHLEVLVSEADAHIALVPLLLDQELKVVDHLGLGHRVVALYAAHVVAVPARAGVSHHQLVAADLQRPREGKALGSEHPSGLVR